jgi:integrase
MVNEWSLPVQNVLRSISKPSPSKGRDRRLVGNEEERLLAAAGKSLAPMLRPCIQLAVETGMRAGELVGLRWEQIDLGNHVIRLKAEATKNGDSRSVPLSAEAEAVILALARPLHGGRFVRFHDSCGLSTAFRRACERAGIEGLRFHDLRHEAASRFAPRMQAPTLAKVMGWKTLQMAMRYYNPTDNELVTAIRQAA